MFGSPRVHLMCHFDEKLTVRRTLDPTKFTRQGYFLFIEIYAALVGSQCIVPM